MLVECCNWLCVTGSWRHSDAKSAMKHICIWTYKCCWKMCSLVTRATICLTLIGCSTGVWRHECNESITVYHIRHVFPRGWSCVKWLPAWFFSIHLFQSCPPVWDRCRCFVFCVILSLSIIVVPLGSLTQFAPTPFCLDLAIILTVGRYSYTLGFPTRTQLLSGLLVQMQ